MTWTFHSRSPRTRIVYYLLKLIDISYIPRHSTQSAIGGEIPLRRVWLVATSIVGSIGSTGTVMSTAVCQNSFIVWSSWISITWKYKVVIRFLLLFSYSSPRTRLAVREISQFGYALNLSVNSVKSCHSYYPILHSNCRPIPEVRSCGIELLLSSDIALVAPNFEDTEHKKTPLTDSFRQK
jgi:hypothetical protein